MRLKIKKVLSSMLLALYLVPNLGLAGNITNVLAASDLSEIQISNAYAEYDSSVDLISNINVLVKDSSTNYPLEGVEVELLVDNVSKGTLLTNANGKACFTYKQNIASNKSATCPYAVKYSELDDSMKSALAEKNIFSSYEEAYSTAYQEAKTNAESYLEKKLKTTQHTYMVKMKNTRIGYEAPNVFSSISRTEKGPQNLELTMTSTPMKGAIHISKIGEGLAGYEDSNGEHTVTLYTPDVWKVYALNLFDEDEFIPSSGDNNQIEYIMDQEKAVLKFIYDDMPLFDVAFELYAGEDIVSPDGSGMIIFHEGELVDMSYTDWNGELSFYSLPLGKYLIKERETRLGYVLDKKSYAIELTADSQVGYCGFNNKLKGIDLSVKNEDFDTGKALSGAVFGLYANTNIYASNGELLIPKDQLIATAFADQLGEASFEMDLPNNSLSDNPDLAMYYVKELKAAEGYVENTEIFYMDTIISESDEQVSYWIIVKDKKKAVDELVTKELLPALPVVHTLASKNDYQIKGQENKDTIKVSMESVTNPVSLSDNNEQISVAMVNTGDNTVVAWYIWTIIMSISFLTILVFIKLDYQKTNQKYFKK